MRLAFAILLFISAAAASAQVPPKAVLIDEFGRIECEDLSGRLDLFLAELNKDPDATGYIVVSSAPDLALRLNWREKFADGYARYRGFDESRLITLRASLEAPIQTQMWSVPAGAQLPVAREIEAEGRLEKSLPRKFRFYSDFGDQGPCYTGPPLRLLSRYLKRNPEYGANIAIGSPSAKSFKSAKDGIIESFKNYRVEASRLRYFWIRTQYDPDIYELWLIRRKPKSCCTTNISLKDRADLVRIIGR